MNKWWRDSHRCWWRNLSSVLTPNGSSIEGTPALLVASETVILTCYKKPQVLCTVLALISCISWIGLPPTPLPAMAKEYWKWQQSILPTFCRIKKENEGENIKGSLLWKVVPTFHPYFQVYLETASSNYCH